MIHDVIMQEVRKKKKFGNSEPGKKKDMQYILLQTNQHDSTDLKKYSVYVHISIITLLVVLLFVVTQIHVLLSTRF